MPSVGSGVSELRVSGMGGIYRVFYTTAVQGGILVFHAFAKKSQQTPGSEISVGRKRLRGLLDA
jgi:phage-related protein